MRRNVLIFFNIIKDEGLAKEKGVTKNVEIQAFWEKGKTLRSSSRKGWEWTNQGAGLRLVEG